MSRSAESISMTRAKRFCRFSGCYLTADKTVLSCISFQRGLDFHVGLSFNFIAFRHALGMRHNCGCQMITHPVTITSPTPQYRAEFAGPRDKP